MDTKTFISFLIGLVLLALSFYLGWYMRGVRIPDTKPNISQGKPTVVTSVDSGQTIIKPNIVIGNDTLLYIPAQVDSTPMSYSEYVGWMNKNLELAKKVKTDNIRKAQIDTTLHLKRDSIKIRTDKPYYFEKEFIEKGLELFYWISHNDSSRVDTIFIPTSLPCTTEESFWKKHEFTFGFVSGLLTFGSIMYIVLKAVGVFK